MASTIKIDTITTPDGTGNITVSRPLVLTAGDIVTADIAADAIDGTKIADNAIDSEHYTDASIDEAHIANDAINFATHLKAGTDGQIISWDASGDPVAVGPGTDGQVLTSTGAGSPPAFETAASSGYTAGTAWMSTSGSYHDFTGIPAGVKHIMIAFRSTSLSGTESFDINLGDAGGVETGTDHMSSSHVIHGSTLTTLSSGDALQVLIANASHAASLICHLVNTSANIWVFSYSGHTWYTGSALGGGSKNISGTLTQIRVSSSSSNTFDGGFVNIVYL